MVSENTQKRILSAVMIVIPFYGGLASIIYAAYTWRLNFLTGGIAAVLMACIMMEGMERMEKKKNKKR